MARSPAYYTGLGVIPRFLQRGGAPPPALSPQEASGYGAFYDQGFGSGGGARNFFGRTAPYTYANMVMDQQYPNIVGGERRVDPRRAEWAEKIKAQFPGIGDEDIANLERQGLLEEIAEHPQGPTAASFGLSQNLGLAYEQDEKQYQEALGTITGARDRALGYADLYGGRALSEARTASARRSAGAEQDLIGRGLYGSTLVDQSRRSESRNLGKIEADIAENQARYRADIEGGYAGQVAGLQGSRPNKYARYAELYDEILRAKLNRPPREKGYEAFIGPAATVGSAAIMAFSDRRVKINVEPLDEVGETVDKLRPVAFRYSAAPSEQRYGFVAQEFAEVFPDSVRPADPQGVLQIDAMAALAVAVREIQSLRARVAALEAA